MKKLLLISSVFLLIFGIAGHASALPITIPSDLAIDFRDAAWGGAPANAKTVGVVTAKANSDYLITQSASSGLGIDSDSQWLDWTDENDEIDHVPKEYLTITIAGGMLLDGFYVTKLFEDEFIFGDEKGRVRINGSDNYKFTATDDPEGDYFIDFGGPITVYSAIFTATAWGSEFAVVGAFSVPEPSTMYLLGLGLVGLVSLRRKKFFKK